MAFEGFLKKQKAMEEMSWEEAFSEGEHYRLKGKKELALEYYIYAGEGGHQEAQKICAQWYETGIGCSVDIKKSLYWWEKIAEQGNAEEQFCCAQKYRESTVWKNAEKTFYWTERAAEQGYLEAQLRCAGMYDCSYGCIGDEEKALQWYEKAAKQGSAVAMYECACKYELENRLFSDEEKALFWFEKAMEHGYTYAKDAYERVLTKLEKSRSYRSNSSEELSSCENLVLEAIGAAEDGDTRWAVEAFIKAARESRDGRYAAVAVNLCLDPEDYNFLDAESAAKLAKELEYPDAEELLYRVYVEIACYSEHEFQCASKEFEETHFELMFKNQDLYWEQYYNDPYVSRTRDNLLHYRRKAANLGHTWSYISIANRQFWDYVITKDERKLKEAAESLTLAQNAGDMVAKGYFGSYIMSIYNAKYANEKLRQGEQDDALKYYRKAAQQGSRDSMYSAAMLLYQGNTKSEIEEAKMWAEKAVELGNTKAINLLSMIVAKETLYQ